MTQADLQRIAHQMGLDRPLPVQYWEWFSRLAEGDWGKSFRTQQDVTSMVGEATWNSILLVGTALIFSVAVAMLVGVVSAVRQYSTFDHVATGFS